MINNIVVGIHNSSSTSIMLINNMVAAISCIRTPCQTEATNPPIIIIVDAAYKNYNGFVGGNIYVHGMPYICWEKLIPLVNLAIYIGFYAIVKAVLKLW